MSVPRPVSPQRLPPQLRHGCAMTEAADRNRRELRLWLRMLLTTRAAEGQLREFLRVSHGTTLPRFDVMAALWRRGEAVSMSELSRMLLVSNGNATAVVDRLEKDGLVRRSPSETDRRTVYVSLTDAGKESFSGLAKDHAGEVGRIFADLPDEDLDTMSAILKRMGERRNAAN